jgi:hypothetical protein
MKFKLVCGVMTLLLVAALAEQSHAQRPSHYYPARPTFSTYLLYRQFNGTGIPNYYQYVRPATQFRDFVNRTTETGRRTTTQVLDVERQVERALESQLRQRPTTGVGRAAIPAQFGNTSHFYQRPEIGRRR